jgi:hypothetical protein
MRATGHVLMVGLKRTKNYRERQRNVAFYNPFISQDSSSVRQRGLVEIMKDWPHFWGIAIPTITSLFSLEVCKVSGKKILRQQTGKRKARHKKRKKNFLGE